MELIRTFACDPDDVFEALDRRLRSEIAADATVAAVVAERGIRAGLSFQGDGGRVRIVRYDRPAHLAWTSELPGSRVSSSYEISGDASGCRIVYRHEFLDGGPFGGAVGEALILGQMSNVLMGLEADAYGGGDAGGAPAGGARAGDARRKLGPLAQGVLRLVGSAMDRRRSS